MNSVLEWAVNSVLGTRVGAGAIDVVAIRGSDGKITSCSPFHVKLPASNVPPSRAKKKEGEAPSKRDKRVVKMKVNGREVELSMKVGSAGEAFFVQRTSAPRVRKGEVTSPRDGLISPPDEEVPEVR